MFTYDGVSNCSSCDWHCSLRELKTGVIFILAECNGVTQEHRGNEDLSVRCEVGRRMDIELYNKDTSLTTEMKSG